MKYPLRTLLILLAVAPPAFGIAALSALRNPVFATLVVAWVVAFICAFAGAHGKANLAGLTTPEWLLVAAILLVLGSLVMPVLLAERV